MADWFEDGCSASSRACGGYLARECTAISTVNSRRAYSYPTCGGHQSSVHLLGGTKASQSPRKHTEHDEALIYSPSRNGRSQVPLPWCFPNRVAVDSSHIHTFLLRNAVSLLTLRSEVPASWIQDERGKSEADISRLHGRKHRRRNPLAGGQHFRRRIRQMACLGRISRIMVHIPGRRPVYRQDSYHSLEKSCYQKIWWMFPNL